MSAHKLVICEKPSQAKAYAAVLNANKRQDGFFEGGGYIVSWCFGHLVELASPDAYGEQYKRWDRATLPILPDKWQYKASKDKAKQLSVLRGLMNRADVASVILATDAGREGELIGRLVYDHCKSKKPIQRLWISSMEDSAVREGFDRLHPGADYDSLYRSALCRARADWLVGINATRLFSCLYGSTLNVGRVQTPTLAMIVSREEAVCGFVSEPFYTPGINTGSFTASGERLKNAETAEAVRAAADGQDAVVLSVEKVQKITAPPKLYDLTTLQREANRIFGFTAQQTLDYAQSLYEKKLLTYPRTDSRYITEDMRGTVAGYFGKDDPKPNIDAIINNAKVTDHHALLPTSVCADVSQLDKMSSGECKILKLVTERLVCAVSPIHVYETVTAVLECGGHKFTAKGKTIITDGWTGVTPDTMSRTARDEKDAALPELVEGQVFQSVSASVKEGKTSPPKRYTEDTLLSAMENAGQRDAGLNIGSAEDDGCGRFGLGTPATRAATIEKLIKSGVVERQKKNLIPTQKGINLIAVLPDSVKSPLLTANWEQKLRLVERGELSEDTFMDGITDMTRKLVADHAAPIEEYKDLFAAASDNRCVTKRDTPQIGVCPRCGSGVAERQKGFFCSNRNCSFALWKDNRFFEAKKKKLTKTVAAALLNEGRVFFSDLYSERMGKTYAASVVLEDIDGKVKFKVIFDGSDSK